MWHTYSAGCISYNSEENLLDNNTCYKRVVGRLLYVATVSRPDIPIIVKILPRKIQNPTKQDFHTVKRVIMYFECTKDLKLVMDNKYEPILRSLADWNWA